MASSSVGATYSDAAPTALNNALPVTKEFAAHRFRALDELKQQTSEEATKEDEAVV